MSRRHGTTDLTDCDIVWTELVLPAIVNRSLTARWIACLSILHTVIDLFRRMRCDCRPGCDDSARGVPQCKYFTAWTRQMSRSVIGIRLQFSAGYCDVERKPRQFWAAQGDARTQLIEQLDVPVIVGPRGFLTSPTCTGWVAARFRWRRSRLILMPRWILRSSPGVQNPSKNHHIRSVERMGTASGSGIGKCRSGRS